MAYEPTIKIPERLLSVLGEPEGASRNVFIQKGSLHHAQGWYLALLRVFGEVVPVPNVTLFVPVSRNAIHKRIKDGKLSCFKFQINETERKGTKRESPHAFVPVYECILWYQEYHDRLTYQMGETAPDYLLLDNPHDNENSFMGLHSKKYVGWGEAEYERLTEEYFENRKQKYGW